MIKFLIKLLIVVAIANAAWRAGNVYLTYYQFEDKVREAVQYRGLKTDAQIKERILQIASDYDVPLAADALALRREQARTIVDGAYAQSTDLLPGYVHTFSFTMHLDIPTSTLP